MAAAPPPDDPLGAFCRANHAALAGASSGPLAGVTFAAKDVFDIAGTTTGFGHPDWLRTHGPAVRTAEAVQRMLDAGATLVGRTLSDELCYSLAGTNHHYGTPANTAAPGHTCGGSSSGSAAAVAGGLVDVALGTDCGGSVRVPASYCGLLGMRPTNGRVTTVGVLPFAASFDTVGWFARDADLLAAVGAVVLDAAEPPPPPPRRLLIATDAFAMLEPDARAAATRAADAVAALFETVVSMPIADEPLATWATVFQTVQAAEIWATLGPWIIATGPVFGPGIRERFANAAQVSPEATEAARAARARIAERIDRILGEDAILCLPTVPSVAPAAGAPIQDREGNARTKAMALLCIAGLCGLPQVSLPLATLDGLPLGLSLVGARGADEHLLALARRLVTPGGVART